MTEYVPVTGRPPLEGYKSKAEIADGAVIAITAYSTIVSGSTTVVTAGTRVALGASTTVKMIQITNPVSNTGILYVGGSTIASTNGIEILPGGNEWIPVDNLSKVYVDASVSGSVVKFNYYT